ncbi:hypothetical protein [Streptomyces sp. NPDC050504]|uniref:hypothetical protein n=1 Tax=Streptomyces sp. NPDC050504 TaxID=3365618 RepID=UPI0037909CF7
MTSRIRSLLPSAPVVVPLASGRTVRLSPGQLSDELPDAEVVDSPKVAKLLGQRAIEVERVDAEHCAAEDAALPAPAESAAGTPAVDTPAGESPAEETPADETPAGDPPAGAGRKTVRD